MSSLPHRRDWPREYESVSCRVNDTLRQIFMVMAVKEPSLSNACDETLGPTGPSSSPGCSLLTAKGMLTPEVL